PGSPGHVQRGTRSGAHAQRSDGEDARGEDPRQARPARPRAGGHPRLRDRPDLPRPSRAPLGTRLAELRGPRTHGPAPPTQTCSPASCTAAQTSVTVSSYTPFVDG